MEREIALHRRERRMASLPAQKRFDRSASACYRCITLTANVEQTKRCYACELEKSLDDFGIDKSKRSGISYRCKDCTRIATAQWKKDNPEKVRITRKKEYERKKECPKFIERRKAYNEKWNALYAHERPAARLDAIRNDKTVRLKEMLNSAKRRALKNNIPFDLTLDDLIAIANDNCAASQEPLDWTYEQGNRGPMIPSLDKIVPELGYVKGNVAIIGHYWNMRKGALTINEIDVLQAYINRHSLQ